MAHHSAGMKVLECGGPGYLPYPALAGRLAQSPDLVCMLQSLEISTCVELKCYNEAPDALAAVVAGAPNLEHLRLELTMSESGVFVTPDHDDFFGILISYPGLVFGKLKSLALIGVLGLKMSTMCALLAKFKASLEHVLLAGNRFNDEEAGNPLLSFIHDEMDLESFCLKNLLRQEHTYYTVIGIWNILSEKPGEAALNSMHVQERRVRQYLIDGVIEPPDRMDMKRYIDCVIPLLKPRQD